MFTNTELKLYAIEAIKESTITVPEKLELVQKLKECSLIETKAFLNKGQMLDEKVKMTNVLKNSIEEDFVNNEKLIESILDEGNVATGLGIAVYGAVPWALWRAANALFSSASRKCGVFKIGVERKICKNKVYIEATTKKLQALGRADCSKSEYPSACNLKKNEQVAKLKEKLEGYKANVNKFKQELDNRSEPNH